MIGRREFIALIGGAAAAWPFTARGQSATPVIGFLSSASPRLYEYRLRSFREGLKEAGYVEGQNVEIDYRWAEGRNDQLPELAAQLVRRRVAVIVSAGGTPTAVAAKAATTTIPIVFGVAIDPVEVGLVTSLSRPGGNVGVTNLNVEVGPKRLELLRELLPSITVIAVLVNPASPAIAETVVKGLQTASRTLGLQLHILQASSERDFDAVFATLVRLQAGALIIAPDVFFNARAEQLGALTVRHAVPAVYHYRAFVAAGGLLSYGSDEADYYRHVGVYAGRVLRGEKPAELPVMQSTKVELTINLKTARALGISVPLPLLARASEVIE